LSQVLVQTQEPELLQVTAYIVLQTRGWCMYHGTRDSSSKQPATGHQLLLLL